ncbi:unnamed protein product [Rotaria sordida]|uniref:Uncharacterized protein n=1 Tax=Rotaria sordida TaxID=392033 RepID=A0A813XKP5_9BILA|nr:unnamed protein product [Rotaria sordida]
MSEEKPILAKNVLLSKPDSNPLTKLRTHLNSETCSCCFNLRPLDRAQIVNEREMSGYAAQLWTLKESRWTSEARAPYHGDEFLPQRPLGNIWNDYQVDRPTKTILDKEGSQEVVRDLKETQRREPCSKYEIFTFCLYGEDERQVYENQYPYKCCGMRSCTLL